MLQDTFLRWRKNLQKHQRQTQKSFDKFLDSHIKNRSLRRIERFVFGWMGVFALAMVLLTQQFSQLDEHYLADGPAPGGHYIEGIVGSIDGINPLFADGAVSEAASKLIFSGLLKPDKSGDMQLDLASGYEISDDETVYTVQLREDAYWHDGESLTARDIAFTIDMIQNPDVASHLQVQWRDIEVDTPDDYTIEFTLPNPFAPFINQLDFGVLPYHLLREADPERLRVASFNQQPVGSGPFAFDQITNDGQLRLRANTDYYQGKPQLDRFTFVTYEEYQQMLDAYNRNELRGMIYTSDFQSTMLDNADKSEISRVEVGGQVFAFFNTESIEDRELRQALTRSLDTRLIRRSLGDDFRVADSPLLPTHLGYRSAQLGFDEETARDQFSDSNLTYNGDDLYEGEERYRLRLVTQDNFNYPEVALSIKEQWEQMGVAVDVRTVSGAELQEEHLRPRNYDVLLFGVGLENDPDVYAYWHSSQARDPGRNVSQYSSEVADINLEDGRTRTDEELRAAKYDAFQQQWRRDAPAVALYRLHAYYVNRAELSGAEMSNITHPVNRFHDVTEWSISTEPVFKRLQAK